MPANFPPMCSAGQRVMGHGHPSWGTCEPFCVTAATKPGVPAFLSRLLVLILLLLCQTSRSSPDPGLYSLLLLDHHVYVHMQMHMHTLEHTHTSPLQMAGLEPFPLPAPIAQGLPGSFPKDSARHPLSVLTNPFHRWD